jgi:hypothetical protein
MPKLDDGIEFDGADMFVVRHGKRIAKRDQRTKTWIPLEPGWQVFDAAVWLNRYSKYWQAQFDLLAAKAEHFMISLTNRP